MPGGRSVKSNVSGFSKIVAILTDSDYQKARNYWKWLKNKLNAEGSQLVSDTNQLKLQAPDGKMRLTDVMDTEQVLRLVQSIPTLAILTFTKPCSQRTIMLMYI